jgi:hypothetical protein
MVKTCYKIVGRIQLDIPIMGTAFAEVFTMAHSGTGYFDSKGQYFKSPEEATMSDLAGLLGRVGEGDSLAPGIANILLEKRADVERIFADHDAMLTVEAAQGHDDGKVAALRPVS